jgi:hypothetical protein
MAVMSARKRAIGNTWKYKNEQKEVTAKQEEEKPISEEEHKARLEKLRALGLLK